MKGLSNSLWGTATFIIFHNLDCHNVVCEPQRPRLQAESPPQQVLLGTIHTTSY